MVELMSYVHTFILHGYTVLFNLQGSYWGGIFLYSQELVTLSLDRVASSISFMLLLLLLFFSDRLSTDLNKQCQILSSSYPNVELSTTPQIQGGLQLRNLTLF